MKYSLVLATLFSVASLSAAPMLASPSEPATPQQKSETHVVTTQDSMPATHCPAANNAQEDVLKADQKMLISVVGQGVAPMNTTSPAQAYALAKRAAVADAYRLIAEKVKGVRVDGQDLIKNMMVKRSTVRTSVAAMVKNANIVETTFKEGLCEVEMEIVLSHAQFQ